MNTKQLAAINNLKFPSICYIFQTMIKNHKQTIYTILNRKKKNYTLVWKYINTYSHLKETGNVKKEKGDVKKN